MDAVSKLRSRSGNLEKLPDGASFGRLGLKAPHEESTTSCVFFSQPPFLNNDEGPGCDSSQFRRVSFRGPPTTMNAY